MAIFAPFLRPVFAASRVQHIPDRRSKFALRPHNVWKYGRHSNLRPLRLVEEKRKKEEERSKPQDENIMACSALLHRAAKINGKRFVQPAKKDFPAKYASRFRLQIDRRGYVQPCFTSRRQCCNADHDPVD